MERIFIAIKDFAISRSFKSLLNDNYYIDCFSNEDEALNAIRENDYSCMILDVSDSKFNGVQIFDILCKTKQIENQPVCLIEDPPSLQRELEFFNKGASEIFNKPIDPIITRKRIQNVITIFRLQKNVQEYEQKLITDPFTGLLNKDGFQSLVRRKIKTKKPGCILMCDLDDLKFMNDTYSHQVADGIIVSFASYLKECMPKKSIVAHISGDEFCVYIPGEVDKEQIASCCTKLKSLVLAKVLLPDLARPVTASVGIAFYPESAGTYENLLFKADHALLYVKNHGKNGFKFYAPRDDREEQLKGRQESTNLAINVMLKKRTDEDIQTWLKFGEFRIIYLTYQKYSLASYEANLCLLNILDTKNPDMPNDKNVCALNDKITTFIKESQLSGIFSWYSINQLLILSQNRDTLPSGIERLKIELAEDMEVLGLKIDLQF